MSLSPRGFRPKPTSASGAKKSRLLRWLRQQRSGPIYRLRRTYMTLVAGPASFGAVVAAIREFWRRSDVESATAVVDGFLLNLAESAARVSTAESQLETSGSLKVAWIGRPQPEIGTDHETQQVNLYPENWRDALVLFQPHLIVVHASGISESGPWAGRLSFSLSPDRLSERDLRALHEEAHERRIPLVLVLPNRDMPSWSSWQESARFFDMVIVQDSSDARLLKDDSRIVGRIVSAAAGDSKERRSLDRLAGYIGTMVME